MSDIVDNINENDKIKHCTDDVYWYEYDLTFEKDYKMCIRHLEKTIRASMEYDLWAKNCKINSPDAVVCPICKDNYYEKHYKCETHHHPVTLYIIVDDIISEMIDNNSMHKTTANDVVKRVLDDHLMDKISYINLCTHCHKKYHDGNPDVNKIMYDIFEDRIQARKAKLAESFISLENEVGSSYNTTGIKNELVKPSFIPAPLPQAIDDGNYVITKFRKD